MIGSFHRKNWHPTLIIFGFIVIFQNRDGQTDKQTDRQTDRQTDNTNIIMMMSPQLLRQNYATDCKQYLTKLSFSVDCRYNCCMCMSRIPRGTAGDVPVNIGPGQLIKLFI